MSEKKEGNRVLEAHLDDLCREAERGYVARSRFLSVQEVIVAERRLRMAGTEFFMYGGYGDAERCRAYILPEYASGVRSVEELAELGEETDTVALLICGSGFEVLTHRAVMGSVLGLGIERAVIGDIVMLSEHRALVFCESRIAEFLLSELKSVGRDKVTLKKTEVTQGMIPERKYQPFTDTVASARLDCVVAAVCSLSRDRAKLLISDGKAELDGETEQRGDRELRPPCILSVRGYGKFRILSLCDKTKKGRIKLSAEKFI